jgi:hypothetical protein
MVQSIELTTAGGSPTRPALWRLPRATELAIVGIIPVIAGYIFYSRWLSLFPQIEFRTWMWSGTGLKWFVVSVFTHQGAFARSSPFVADSVTKAVCGISIRCINEPGFWTILLAGYLLFWLIVRLTDNIFGAVLAATLWVLSVPVLDGFAWQATLGDRLAVLFGLATVHVALSMMRWVTRGATVITVIVANCLVLVPAIITYNSKEISWLVVPSLILLSVALTDDRGLSAIARRASVLLGAGAYSVFRIIDTFVLLGESPGSKSLDFGGAPAHNSNLYIAFLANRVVPGTISHVMLVIVLGAGLTAAFRYRTAGRDVRSQIQIMVWAASSLLGGLVLCLFTPFPGPYLLLFPSAFLWVALVALWNSSRVSHGAMRTMSGLGVAAVGATVMLLGLSGSYGLYGDILAWSRHFSRSLPVIANNVPMGAPTDFVIGGAPFVAYRFVGTNGQRLVDQFIYHKTGLLLAPEARINNVTSLAKSFPGYSVVFGSALDVTEVLHGSQVIYQEHVSQ